MHWQSQRNSTAKPRNDPFFPLNISIFLWVLFIIVYEYYPLMALKPQCLSGVTRGLGKRHPVRTGRTMSSSLHCPKCGALVTEDAIYCSKCGSVLQSQQSITPLSPSSYPPVRGTIRTYAILGFISAFLGLLVVPEIFGSVAIILGAYTWRRERDGSQNMGLIVLVLGIICMMVGIYYTSYFSLGDILP
jgi:hypothetical protein